MSGYYGGGPPQGPPYGQPYPRKYCEDRCQDRCHMQGIHLPGLQLIINKATELVSIAYAPCFLRNQTDQCQLQLPHKATVGLRQASISAVATHKAATAHRRALLRASMVAMAHLLMDLHQVNMVRHQDLHQDHTALHPRALQAVTMARHHQDTTASTSSLHPWQQALQHTPAPAMFPIRCPTRIWACRPMDCARP